MSREGSERGFAPRVQPHRHRLIDETISDLAERLRAVEKRLGDLALPRAVRVTESLDEADFDLWPLEAQRASYQADYKNPGTSTVFMDDLGHMFATLDCGGDVNFTIYSLDNTESAFASLNPPEVIRLHKVLSERITEYGEGAP